MSIAMPRGKQAVWVKEGVKAVRLPPEPRLVPVVPTHGLVSCVSLSLPLLFLTFRNFNPTEMNGTLTSVHAFASPVWLIVPIAFTTHSFQSMHDFFNASVKKIGLIFQAMLYLLRVPNNYLKMCQDF